jgi:hypothetical protein
MRDIHPDLYLDCTGDQIDMGYLLTPPANVKADGKPLMFKGIMTCVGRHRERNTVFVRYMGDDMVHEFEPAKLQIIAPSARNRQPASLAEAA